MGVTRLIPNNQRTPSLRGQFIQYYSRGQWLIRAWPRPAGPPKSLKVKDQTRWFGGMVQLLKRAPDIERINATDGAHKIGLYPDDVMMIAAAGNAYKLVDADGVEYQKRKLKVVPTMFTGCRLIRTTNLAIAAGVAKAIPFQASPIDTSGFWDIATPHLITIPTGINVVSLEAGIDCTDTSTTYQSLGVELVGTGFVSRQDQGTSTTHRFGTSTGPIPVAPGLQFFSHLFLGRSCTLFPNQNTYFSLTVLDAD